MKILSILMGFLIVILTAGCATVVYRVTPDSPSTMSIEEARDAFEIAFTLAKQPAAIEPIKFQGDRLSRHIHGGATVIAYADYDDISTVVGKQGEEFTVDIVFRTYSSRGISKLYWKSENDARSFVNAAYTLRLAKRGVFADRKPVQAPTIPEARKVPKEEPKQVVTAPVQLPPSKEATSLIKIEKPDTARKDLLAVAPAKESIRVTAIPLEEKTFPKILIISPDVTRAVSVVAKKFNLTIIGIAESKIGIANVLINGQHADIDEKGNFSADVLLKAGKNDITVTAIDVHKNQVTKQFVVNREAGKVALVRKEKHAAETGFMSGKYHALLIAIQDYSNPEIGKLDYPVSDARRLMDVLSSRYNFEKENITLLHNPDRKTIYKTLQSMRKQLDEKDSLLIFYAGHGMWLDDMKQGFWLPKDAAGLNDPSDWIPNSNIRDYIKAIKAKHILLVADACFSGGIFKLRDAPSSSGTSVERIYELPSRKAMTSGSLKTVPDQSVFVEFLIKRLEENKDPYIDAQKLFAKMREAVINNSKTNQTPLYGAINEAGDEGGDFIFVRKQ